MDISFLLTQLLGDGNFKSSIDENKVGLIGFSFGGYTALSIAGIKVECELLQKNARTKEGKKEFTIPELGDIRKLIYDLSCSDIPKSFTDKRFTSIVALAPALGLGLPEEDQNITSPLLIIGIEEDEIAPVKTNAQMYHEKIPSSELRILKYGAGHYIFLSRRNEELRKVARRYYRDGKGVDRAEIHKKVSSDIIAFLSDSWQ